MSFIYGFANDSSGGPFALWTSLIDALADVNSGANGAIVAAPGAGDGLVTGTSTTSVQLAAFAAAVINGQVGSLSAPVSYTVPDNTSGSTRFDAVSMIADPATGILTIGYRTGSSSAYTAGANEMLFARVSDPSHASGSAATSPTVTDVRSFMPRRMQLAGLPGVLPSAPRVGEVLVDANGGLFVFNGSQWGSGNPSQVTLIPASLTTTGTGEALATLSVDGGDNVGGWTVPGSPGTRALVPMAGTYEFDLFLRFATSSASSGTFTFGLDNGSVIAAGYGSMGGGTNFTGSLSGTVQLTAGAGLGVFIIPSVAGINISGGNRVVSQLSLTYRHA